MVIREVKSIVKIGGAEVSEEDKNSSYDRRNE